MMETSRLGAQPNHHKSKRSCDASWGACSSSFSSSSPGFSRAAGSHLHSWSAPVDFSTGLSRLLRQRETLGQSEQFRHALHTHSSLLPRLVCESMLVGHEGCVNQVCWNETGSLLASGSDDTRVILWDYATRKQRQVIDTGHVLNIFGVCFVPGTNDHIVASGAMDCDVRIHYAPFRKEETKLFRVHKGRVKDITCSYGVPKVFWSVAEDGTVFQFDVRHLPRTNGSGETHDASGVLVKLGRTRTGRVLRGMGMACHPLDFSKIVLACGDFYTRLYDRRMLRIQRRSTETNNAAPATNADATIPVEVFAPPHFHLDDWCDKKAQRAHDCCHGTSVQFDHTGSKVLTNYHNDHIYLFEVNHGSKPVGVFQKYHQQRMDQCWRNGMLMDEQFWYPFDSMPLEVIRDLHSKGVAALLTKNYSKAISFLCAACSEVPESSKDGELCKELYHDLAKAYLGRKWQSDMYLAATYCKRAIEIDSQEPSFWLTYLRTLEASHRKRHMKAVAHGFQRRFPHLANDVEHFARDSPRHNGNRGRRFGARSSSDSGSGSSHERRRFASSSDEEELDEEEYMSDEYDHEEGWSTTETSHDDDNQTTARVRLPSYCDATKDDAFWKSCLVNTRQVNCNPVRRYLGYCNIQTDIKEATFFGQNDAYIVAGSDDGRAYMWETKTGRLLSSIVADEDIVNCVQCHPIDSCLATSGIENVVRLWSPLSDEPVAPSTEELEEMIHANQRHMMEDSTRLLQAVGSNSLIRLLIQAGEEEGAQECTPS